MPLTVARIAADSLRVLPRSRVSRALGKVAGLRAPKMTVSRLVSAFCQVYDVDMDEAVIPIGGYRSFNDFFTRRLRPGARPVDPDPKVITSPADGVVEDLGKITLDATVRVKGRNYSVAELIGEDAEHFAGGVYVVVYLSPRDYHRVHTPVAGHITHARYLPGTLFPVNAIADHVPQVFARNERIATFQTTVDGVSIATVMVGAIGVGHIQMCFDEALQSNQGRDAEDCRRYGNNGPPMEKGEELGLFNLGSTAIVFLPPKSTLRVGEGAVLRVGEPMAELGPS